MQEYRYEKIDAFTSGDSLGNPAACLYLTEGQTLSADEMLDIARQHKGFVSEVACCETRPQGPCLTYYSSECEVDFCGHATIACMYSLIKGTPSLLSRREIEIHTHKKGVLTVYNEIAEQDAVYITAPAPRDIGTNLSVETVADALGLAADRISRRHPLDVVDAGLKTLIVPLTTLRDEIDLFPDERRLKIFCENGGVDIVLIFTMETADAAHIAHTRVFAPKFGYLEDPATGSGNSAFGNYMLKNRLWDGNAVSLEQGGSDRVFNVVRLTTKNDRVLFGGRATTRIKGTYYL